MFLLEIYVVPFSAKILIVDDNETNVEILSEILRYENYEIVIAYDGEYAIELCNEIEIDLLLLDILLPGINGFEVARILQSNPKTQDISILFVSALHETKNIVKALDMGAVDYITKPFQEAEILARVRSQLKIRRLEREKSFLLRSLKADLDIAKSNQQNLVSFKFPPSKDYQVYTSYSPMEQVGGDWITYEVLPSHDLDILFGDVTGHGVAAAMISLMAIISFKNMTKAFLTPSECLHWLHNNLSPLIETHFISAIYLRYNPQNRLLSYSMAGHHPMILIREDKIFRLGTKGFCLLMFPQLVVENKEFYLQEKDRLFLFSDGMYEVPDSEDNYMGDNVFLEEVKKNCHLPPKDFLKAMQDFSLDFGNGQIQDDMTMLILDIE